MYPKRMSLAAVLAAAALGLTACGGSTDAAGNTADTASSGPTTATSSTAPSGSYTPLTKDNFASTIADSYQAKKTAHVQMTLGSAVKASGEMSYADGKPSMKLNMSIAQGSKKLAMEELVVDGVLYMSAPGLTPPGKYIKIDSDTPGMGSMADMLDKVDPASMVTHMSKSITALKYVGTATIASDRTRHYRLSVDAKKAVGNLGLKDMPSGAASSIPKAITYDAYLNEDNTLRRITMDVMGQPIQMDMTDWGAPVTIIAPPKSAVVDLGATMPSMPAKP